MTTRPHRGQPLGILVYALGHRAQLTRNVTHLSQYRRQASRENIVRRAAIELRQRRADRVRGAAIGDEQINRRGTRVTVLCSVGQHVLFVVERGVLIGVDECRGAQLVDLESIEIDLAGAGALVTTQVG